MKTECEMYSPKSIADVVMEQDISRLRKWFLRELVTPWWVKVWQRWKASRPIKDSEIPF